MMVPTAKSDVAPSVSFDACDMIGDLGVQLDMRRGKDPLFIQCD